MGIMNLITTGLRWVLDTLFQFTNSYGFSIILATILVRLLLYPLTLSQTKSMIAMKRIQPEMDAIKAKYQDDKDKLNQKMMELYQEHKINPLGGCLPLLIQLPILWAFFRVLRDTDFGEAVNFLNFWVLNEPDKFYILPLLAAATTYLQSRMTITDNQQSTMMIAMPLMIGFFSISLPSGLVLYWITSNVFSIVQQWYINKMYPVQ